MGLPGRGVLAVMLCLLAVPLIAAAQTDDSSAAAPQQDAGSSATAGGADQGSPPQNEPGASPAQEPPAQSDATSYSITRPQPADAQIATIPVPEKPDKPDLQVPEQSGAQRLDEVVVTAQKRVQRLVDVPINVSAMSRDDVERARIQQVRDLSGYVPSLDIKEQVPGAIPVVSIRGIGLDDFSSTNSPAAGIYVDQVTLSSLALMSFDLYDIERIEVLKGPQGTLYGRNSTAGAINVLSSKPTMERESYLKLGGANYKTKDVEGMFNIPVGDLAIRVAGRMIRQDQGMWNSRLNADDGYSNPMAPLGGLPALVGVQPLRQPDTSMNPIKRDIGRRNVAMGRVRLLWDAVPHLTADLKIEGTRQRSEMGQPEQFGSFCDSGYKAINQEHCTDSVGYSDTDHKPYEGDWRGNFPYTIDQLGETLLLDYEFDSATLSSVTGHIKLDRFFHIDVDGGPEDAFEFYQSDTVNQFSQELRLAGGGDLGEWLLGAFWSKDDITVYTVGHHEDAIPTETSLIDDKQGTRSAAAFANMDWKLSERLSLTTGLRYTTESRDFDGGSHWSVEIPNNIMNNHAVMTISDKNWSYKLGLNFAPTHSSLIYANLAKGVKSGGFFSGVTTDQAQLDPYKPEHLTAYEIGGKTSGVIALNASAFYYDYKDVQTFKRSNTAPVQFIGNVDQAKVRGADFEALWRAAEGLTLQAGVGLLRSQLGPFVGPTGAPVPAGNRLANAPPATVNLLARYEFPLFSDAHTAAVQIDAHYSGDIYKEATNDPLLHSEPYKLYNARLSFAPAERNWELAFWGRNLGNTLYMVNGLDIGAFFFGNRNYNAPRTFGGDLRITF